MAGRKARLRRFADYRTPGWVLIQAENGLKQTGQPFLCMAWSCVADTV
jgi:hypothetical protein